MTRKAVFAGLLALALGVPALAGPRGAATAESAAKRIEAAQGRIDGLAQAEASRPADTDATRGAVPGLAATRGHVAAMPAERPTPRSARATGLERAQQALTQAQDRFAQGDFEQASRLAYQAERLAWRASDPRKGEK